MLPKVSISSLTAHVKNGEAQVLGLEILHTEAYRGDDICQWGNRFSAYDAHILIKRQQQQQQHQLILSLTGLLTFLRFEVVDDGGFPTVV